MKYIVLHFQFFSHLKGQIVHTLAYIKIFLMIFDDYWHLTKNKVFKYTHIPICHSWWFSVIIFLHVSMVASFMLFVVV